MSQVLDRDFQSLVSEAIFHEARMAGAAIQEAAGAHMSPSAVFKPRLSVDGDQWCALYGENLQDGVAGFGGSPAEAMLDFDSNWHAKLNPKKAGAALDSMMDRASWPSLITAPTEGGA